MLRATGRNEGDRIVLGIKFLMETSALQEIFEIAPKDVGDPYAESYFLRDAKLLWHAGTGKTGRVITIRSARHQLRGHYNPLENGARSGGIQTTSCLYPVPPHGRALTGRALGLGKRQMESSPMGVHGVSRAGVSRLVNARSAHS